MSGINSEVALIITETSSLFKMLYATGMRVGEFTKLKIEDIDFQERFINIAAENTKTKTSRTVWIPQEVLSEIKAYLKITRKKNVRGEISSLTKELIKVSYTLTNTY